MNLNSKRSEIDELLEKTDKLRLSDSSKTILLAQKAIKLCKEIDYKLGIAIANYRIADAYRNMGKYEDAILLLFDSLDFIIKEGYYDLEWWGYNCLGIIFSDIGDYVRSMNLYNRAQIAANEIALGKKYNINFSKNEAIVLTLNNIAENYKFLKNYKEALNYCTTAYNIDKEYDFSLSKGITCLSLGEIYYLFDDYDKASTLALASIEYLQHYEYDLAVADAYKILALSYWKKNDFLNAEKYFEITINMNHKQASVYYEIETFLAYYGFLESQDKIDRSLDALKHAFKLSFNNNILNKIAETSGLLANFYEKVDDKINSFNYYKLYYEYSNKRLASFNNQLVKNFNIRNKIYEIENEKKKIEKRNEHLKRKSHDLQTIVEKISIISELGQSITSITDLDSIIDILYSSIKNFMNLAYFAIGLYDEQQSLINYLDVINNDKKFTKNSTSMNNTNSLAVKCINTHKIIIINNLSEEYSKYIDEIIYSEVAIKNNFELNSLVFWPLLIKTKVIGVLTIQSTEKNAFSPYQIEMVRSLSSYAAIAINNALKSKELENLNRKLLFLSEHDSMTKVHNRGKFDSYLYHLWHKNINEKKQISLLLIDIDYFKEFNDNYGHVEGDNCIMLVANTITSLVNEKYFVARYGGDEFVVILPDSKLETAVSLGIDIKNEMSKLNIVHEFPATSNKVTLSIGVASIVPSQDISINEFIRKADAALYSAKKSGRNTVEVFK
jgi:diguanylate cyclase (GGDEF)-like protein